MQGTRYSTIKLAANILWLLIALPPAKAYNVQ